jgi:hypothetical protein
MLRLRVARDLLPLADDYRLVLANYLQKRDKAGYAPALKGQPMTNAQLLMRDTIYQLNALDARRQAVHEQISTTAVTPTDR